MSVESRYRVGMAQYMLQNYDAATAAFAGSLAIVPQDDDMYIADVYWLVLSQLRAGKADEAQKTLQQHYRPDMYVGHHTAYEKAMRVAAAGFAPMEDMLAELDYGAIPNFQLMDPQFTHLSFDPENKYTVPYTWGTLGIMYNTTMVDETVDSWNILWDEKYKGNIIMYDSSRDSMAVALRKLGYSVNTKNDAEIEAAAQALTSQKPLVKAYMTDAIKQAMVGGSAALSVVYSGDAMLCMEENPDLAYVVPKEGSNMWFDSIVVTKDCQNMDAAYRFINFLCDPEVAAKNSEYIGYSTPNKEALALMDEEMKADPAYNPPAEVVEKCEVYLDLGDKTDLYNQLWEKVKVN